MKVEFLGISMPQLVHGYHSTAMKTGGLIINFLVLSIAFETSNQIWGYFHGLVVYNHEKDKPTKLIGGLEHFLFFHSVGNIIIPTDFHIFQRGRAQPPTSQHLDGYTIQYENPGNPSSYLGELHGPHWSRPKPGIMGIGWNWVSFRPQVLQ